MPSCYGYFDEEHPTFGWCWPDKCSSVRLCQEYSKKLRTPDENGEYTCPFCDTKVNTLGAIKRHLSGTHDRRRVPFSERNRE